MNVTGARDANNGGIKVVVTIGPADMEGLYSQPSHSLLRLLWREAEGGDSVDVLFFIAELALHLKTEAERKKQPAACEPA